MAAVPVAFVSPTRQFEAEQIRMFGVAFDLRLRHDRADAARLLGIVDTEKPEQIGEVVVP